MLMVLIVSAACGATASRVAGLGFVVMASLLALIGALHDAFAGQAHLAGQIAFVYAAFVSGYLFFGAAFEFLSADTFAGPKLKSKAQK